MAKKTKKASKKKKATSGKRSAMAVAPRRAKSDSQRSKPISSRGNYSTGGGGDGD